MARKRGPKGGGRTNLPGGKVEDAVIVRDVADPTGASVVTPVAAHGPDRSDAAAKSAAAAPVSDATSGARPAPASVAAERPEVTTVPPVRPAPEAAPVAARPASESNGPGFVPLLLGGLVAGAIGWAAATFLTGADEAAVDLSPLEGRVASLEADDRIAALEAEIATLRAATGAPVEGGVDITPLTQSQAAIEARLSDLADRLGQLEAAPPALAGDLSKGGSDQAPLQQALATVGGDLGALRDDVAALSGEVEALRGDTAEQITAATAPLSERVAAVETRLAEIEDVAGDAEAEAARLARAAARNQLAIAVETGVPFDEQVDALGDVPDPLARQAEAGVPTAQDLSDPFPALSRDALRAARAAGADDVGGLNGFLRAQLGARSLEPREGDDPDAVLSRAEAAVRDGDLDAALAEIEALPPEARAVLEDWAARARARREAEAALTTYLEG